MSEKFSKSGQIRTARNRGIKPLNNPVIDRQYAILDTHCSEQVSILFGLAGFVAARSFPKRKS